jgi:hypothetical protein
MPGLAPGIHAFQSNWSLPIEAASVQHNSEAAPARVGVEGDLRKDRARVIPAFEFVKKLEIPLGCDSVSLRGGANRR